ncbi:hypothetical protein [Rhodoferax saidenbachensis]|uniref:Chemotaxis phosphatase CheX-like domain-containing protein n=1 Tax=Rhodoferax saidenbachensis TaxID=1484693 RepID=A0A1P8K942_9BURK|nr:hypothetical protein [Rhodoferax saidenbachensis]APW42480.1 hypothetical protein RS694_07990 [Rhodoferax saidenbachensis]
MISQRAKNGLNQWFSKALKGALSGSQGDLCSVEAVEQNADFFESRFVMLTSSSYLFRAFTLIHFELNAATREHLAKLSRSDAESMSEKEFMDAICECANMCGGALNREFGSVFNHVGLSTPNILGAESAHCLQSLRHGHSQHFRVDFNRAHMFHASLYVCEFEDLDFDGPQWASDHADIGGGELELF